MHAELTHMMYLTEKYNIIAFDTEFSGLSVGFDDMQHDYDTIETKYQKIKHNCQRMNAF